MHLCLQDVEYIDHLLVAVCVFQRGLVQSAPTIRMAWPRSVTSSLHGVPNSCRRAFGSLVVATGWAIWNQRMDRTFRGQAQQPAAIVQVIKSGENWCRAGLVNRS
jgi:hypothetical protein